MAILKSTLLLFVFVFSYQSSAFEIPAFAPARDHKRESDAYGKNADIQNDQELVRANQSRRPIHFLVAANVEVTRVLEDDENGARHQRFYVRLSDNSEVHAVYSLEDGRGRVPVRVGAKVTLAGEYKWTRFGGLMHWLHEDDKDRRPDGFVLLDGMRYGDNP